MSTNISQEMLGQAQSTVEDERVQDLTLVAATTVAAEREGRTIDDHFVEGLAQDRLKQASEHYEYPVPMTMPTLRSSLWIVRDIMAIRHLEATKEERLDGVDLRGTGDIALAGAVGLERQHRIWEKGVLRIYDQHTSRSMWSVDYDNLVFGLGKDNIERLSKKLVEKQLQRENPHGRRQAHG